MAGRVLWVALGLATTVHALNVVQPVSRRRILSAVAALPLSPSIAAAASSSEGLFDVTFDTKAIGLELDQSDDGRILVQRVKRESAAWAQGVPPLIYIDAVNGETVAGSPVANVQERIRRASRPVRITFDRGEAYAGLAPDEIVAKAAAASGFETSRVRIAKVGDQFVGESACAFKSRAGDVIEIDYDARLATSGRSFDSTGLGGRGHPFSALLGNGDLLRGLELGVLEMCIGEERRIEIPPVLAFGSRGSKLYGVPADTPLVYEVRLLSINGVADAKARREDIPDEQRYLE